MSQPKPQLLCIRGGDTIFACRVEGDRAPELIYFGPATDLSDGLLPPPAPPPWSVGEPVPLSLFPQYGFGFFAEPALLGHPWDGVAETTLKLVRLEALPDRLSLELEDPRIGLRLTLDLELDDNGVLASRASLVNGGERDYALHRLAALCLPLPSWATELRFFDGGVFKEGHMRSAPLSRAKAELITRTGRPGHDWNPYLFACEPSATDERGRVLAVHLAHPGNAALAAERVGELGAQILASEWLAPGEVVLAPGDSYVSPPCLAALSHAGFNGVSARLHPRLRRRLRPSRPVQLNTWEGVYLDVDEPTAMALATEAASLGVERFVLDDGWFTGRATDAAGLGDWRPDPLKFPRGLGPLIGHVKGLGMGFGLWVEPEMVNPDSELYRQHPDWTLAIDGAPRPLWRNQLALDLTREAASDHVLGALRRLLSQHPIEYIKWDCNRALFPAANTAAHQARAFLRILGQLKAEFPQVMFESCASGGGRLDFGTMQLCQRMWVSDNTDPIERCRIQRSASIMFPPEMMGAHVGASPNPTTERGTPMAFRCLVSLFGHFGLELDPRRLTADERAVLERGIALYKAERDFISGAALHRLDCVAPGVDAQLLLGADGKRGLLRVLQAEDVRPGPRPKLRLPMVPHTPFSVTEVFLDGNAPQLLGGTTGAALGAAGMDALPPFASMGRLFVLDAPQPAGR